MSVRASIVQEGRSEQRPYLRGKYRAFYCDSKEFLAIWIDL